MRVFCLTLGTRGDVELFRALGVELCRRGHSFTLASSPFHGPRVEAAGLGWQPIGPGTQAELVAVLRSLAALPDDRARVQGYLERWLRPQVSASLPAIKAGLTRADYVIDNLKNVWTRGGAVVPGANVTYEPPGSLENLAKHASRLARHDGALLELVALNRDLVDPGRSWGAPYRFTGFWHAPWQGAWSPPDGLRRFLAAGPAPVVVTMGSMVMFDAGRLLDALVRALARVDARAVVVGGWADLSRTAGLPSFVHCVDEAPYDWLLPRASCVVHHGGCGTVSAALRAGTPSILVPQISSQRHFAALLAREGLVAGTLDAAAPDAGALGDALESVARDTALREAAQRWRSVVAGDDGIAVAADAIEAHWNGLASGTRTAQVGR